MSSIVLRAIHPCPLLLSRPSSMAASPKSNIAAGTRSKAAKSSNGGASDVKEVDTAGNALLKPNAEISGTVFTHKYFGDRINGLNHVFRDAVVCSCG